MENDINSWLIFADKVEENLQAIETQSLAETYLADIFSLVDEMRTEAKLIGRLSLIKKQEAYIRINKLGNELRNTAYFAH